MLAPPTRSLVISLRTANPRLSTVEIGREVGVTRERVRQILKSERLPTRPPSEYFCPDCGRATRRTTSTGLPSRCPACHAVYLSLLWVDIPCAWCGEIKPMLLSQLKKVPSAKRYCNRSHRSSAFAQERNFSDIGGENLRRMVQRKIAQTLCLRGHKLTLRKDGIGRECVTCQQARDTLRYQRKKLAALVSE
jgi:hypothetical protein